MLLIKELTSIYENSFAKTHINIVIQSIILSFGVIWSIQDLYLDLMKKERLENL